MKCRCGEMLDDRDKIEGRNAFRCWKCGDVQENGPGPIVVKIGLPMTMTMAGAAYTVRASLMRFDGTNWVVEWRP